MKYQVSTARLEDLPPEPTSPISVRILLKEAGGTVCEKITFLTYETCILL